MVARGKDEDASCLVGPIIRSPDMSKMKKDVAMGVFCVDEVADGAQEEEVVR